MTEENLFEHIDIDLEQCEIWERIVIEENIIPKGIYPKEVMKDLWGIDVPEPETTPCYKFDFLYEESDREYTTVTLDRNRKLHSYNGEPSWAYEEDDNFSYEWHKHGELHREDGPAVISCDEEEYWLDGELHREDGPVVIPSVKEEYWLDGAQLSEEESVFIRWFYEEQRERENRDES